MGFFAPSNLLSGAWLEDRKYDLQEYPTAQAINIGRSGEGALLLFHLKPTLWCATVFLTDAPPDTSLICSCGRMVMVPFFRLENVFFYRTFDDCLTEPGCFKVHVLL